MHGSRGLSARRVRRTNSSLPEGFKNAGLKGRQLEVVAQTWPRLLIAKYLLKWGWMNEWGFEADLDLELCTVCSLRIWGCLHTFDLSQMQEIYVGNQSLRPLITIGWLVSSLWEGAKEEDNLQCIDSTKNISHTSRADKLPWGCSFKSWVLAGGPHRLTLAASFNYYCTGQRTTQGRRAMGCIRREVD